MEIALDPKQVVSFEELLLSQVVQQEALTRLLVKKGVFTKDEFLVMVKAVDREGRIEKLGKEGKSGRFPRDNVRYCASLSPVGG